MRRENEETLRKLHAQYPKIRSTEYPEVHNSEVYESIQDLEFVFPQDGKVQPRYAKETKISYKYALTVRHYITNKLLIDDVRDGERIVFNNYYK
ncbi:glycine-tRNA synthetase subunit beta [Oceanobacillus picturae]|uniref:Glycine-tRNA synthetase subunit beta n=1 Tax=Oceanobacillus picturae TaxID=171693 RepID=A0A0U9H9Z8_9BACI|nr:hypothetical protein [Oceanobacillus picturae]GAQ19491.1 glycine-tRNA synthetase subunit beta [Oceanobacillus picturae]